MPLEPSNGAADEERLGEAVASYLEAVEAGDTPDRGQWLARYADIAGELAEFFADQDQVERDTAGLRAVAQKVVGSFGRVATWEGGTGTLGDFRILRPLGRGGMGIVYEAEQVSLGRKVALKVLPFAGALDPRQLQRFKNEAQAAAHLHHTNIVPVHFVGCERGVHYYAMQLIEGCTLAALIRALRGQSGRKDTAGAHVPASTPSPSVPMEQAAPAEPPPTGPYVPPLPVSPEETLKNAALTTGSSPKDPAFFRNVARLGIQAALALEHAHQMGVVHRDIKPGNLLLDERGNLWVADFGLAQFQAGAELTMTGDLLGTLRYMSPEQALAKRVIIDHRTDIYSLGVTLYELLTLVPAVGGKDREEILRQIAFEEPKPPRRLDWRVPAELETIVLKAMEKNPADRYATAQALADDLRRWQEDKPIQARRPTLVQRARKWGQRHQPIVWSAVAVVALAGVMALASLAYTNRRIGTENERIAEERDLVAKERDVARAQRKRAREAVDTMYTRVAQELLSTQPGMEDKRREFLTAALKFYQDFAQEEGADPEHQFQTALAYTRIGNIQRETFRDEPHAREAYLAAMGILEKLSQAHPGEPAYKSEIAGIHNWLAWTGGGETELRRSASAWEELVAAYPSERRFRRSLAMALQSIGDALGPGRNREREMVCRRAVDVFEDIPTPRTITERIQFSMCLHELAVSLEWAGRFPEALDRYQEAIDALMPLAGRNPDVPDFQLGMPAWHWMNFASANGDLADLLRRTGKYQEARPLAERRLRIIQRLAEMFPKSTNYLEGVHRAYRCLARLEAASGRPDAAQTACRQALRVAEELCAREPIYGGRELAFFLLTPPDSRFRDPRRAMRLCVKLVSLRPDFRECWRSLTLARYRLGEYQGALQAAGQGQQRIGSEDRSLGFIQAMCHWQLGDRVLARQLHRETAAWMNANCPGEETLCSEREEAARLIGVNDRSPGGLRQRAAKAPERASSGRP
jgi:serine/threonine protein kinase